MQYCNVLRIEEGFRCDPKIARKLFVIIKRQLQRVPYADPEQLGGVKSAIIA